MGIQFTPQNSYLNPSFQRSAPGFSRTEENSTNTSVSGKAENAPTESDETDDAKNDIKSGDNNQELSSQDQREIEQLKKRDLEVKAHEMAHVAAGGQYIRSSVNFEYKKGPDGQKYAVGGDVSIDIAEIPGDPTATISKMQIVQKAALAPLKPSSTDMRVAAKASRIEARARIEATAEQAKQLEESTQKAKLMPSEKTVSNRYENQASDTGSVRKGQMIDIAA